MENRLKGELSPNGRIDRDSEKEYRRKQKAKKETLRYYFSKEWFGEIKGRYEPRSASEYQMSKCPTCKKVWNIYLNVRKEKAVKYWDDFQRLPMEKITCLNCIK